MDAGRDCPGSGGAVRGEAASVDSRAGERGGDRRCARGIRALCLYYPDDPRERRWTADKGLLDLLYLVVDHLLAEQYWRATGGHSGGIWMFDEAEHGFTREAA